MLNSSWAGISALLIFLIAYTFVIFEEKTHLRKSKPVVVGGCLMWMLVGIFEAGHGTPHSHHYVKELIAEIGELFFFLLAAMTYINTLDERNVFKALRSWLLNKGLGFRQLFWATGGITFCLSPMADNLTSALLMATVTVAVGEGNKKFIVLSFINIVVAANAGGAWSPFGDITTLMVWTSGKIQTNEFIYLVIPSTVNWLVTALIMHPFVPNEKPSGSNEIVHMKPGAKVVIALGISTIATAVSFHQFLGLPPFMGMMLGMGALMVFGHYLKRQSQQGYLTSTVEGRAQETKGHFDIFRKIEGVEFDTLLFFFGVLTAVGCLQYIGYLAIASEVVYGQMGPTLSNVLIGVFSAIVDNIPVMYAVLKMDPSMGLDQWLLIILTAGTGGSLLSIGSAAGVAVMGVAREHYTFMSHLKWVPAIALGYFFSIAAWYFVTMPMR
ncbi:MAG: sodium:proton antiporter NhaD [Nitrospinae bacterium]|nr:sodium:proton antiporter NhaD [Nitrospinota bacterium]MBL7020473.1 sodium:proton antiporter NhaD [Nitrospinaceae bacterium]